MENPLVLKFARFLLFSIRNESRSLGMCSGLFFSSPVESHLCLLNQLFNGQI